MARSVCQTLTLARNLAPKSPQPSSFSLLQTLRTQSNVSSPAGGDLAGDVAGESTSAASAAGDPLLTKLEDAIHRIIVQRSEPDWLPFIPGSSYWVPRPRSRDYGLNQLVEKLANPISQEESMSTTTVRGWPSSDYFIQGAAPHQIESVEEKSNKMSQLEEDEG